VTPMSGSNFRRSTLALSPFAASSRSVRATVRRRLGVHGMMPTRRLRSSSSTAARPTEVRKRQGRTCPPPIGPQTKGLPVRQSSGGALIEFQLT
jgi:hypothetical protein